MGEIKFSGVLTQGKVITAGDNVFISPDSTGYVPGSMK
ncbi:hypothetical protein [Escherichia coli ISC41]|nr:hypothetical protein [Escherichia coli ISC41]